ncbi:hypothetical protein ACO2Q3_14825 [Caulobacter sp. KR2-114]|uniref:hypothetical protein n=1 Tax=Caulobacter sp. KR2-114 TaxID=3400912 RepID=UPI003C0E03D7
MIDLPWRRGLLVVGLALVANAAAAMNTSGWKFEQPSVAGLDQGVRVHGSVCRISAVTPGGLSGVRIELVDGSGRLLAFSVARLSRDLAGRDVGCAFYDRRTDWQLNVGDRVRVCAAGDGDCPVG